MGRQRFPAFDIEQEGIAHQAHQCFARRHRREAYLIGVTGAEEIHAPQRPRFRAKRQRLAGQQPRLGSVLDGRRQMRVIAHQHVPAVVPQADRRMARLDRITARFGFEQQRIVGQKAVASQGETCRQRGLAAPRFAEKNQRPRWCLDGTGMKHPLALAAQRQWQHLVQIEVPDGVFGDAGKWPGRHDPAVCRNLEIGKFGKAQKIA